MPRIRTIKPEFPQSESVGRLSRDARLLFIQLWTLVDDSSRARASSRLLASLLYPYDEDAPGKMPAWLSELEDGGFIRIYQHEDTNYLDIPKWLKHQKIDRPSASRIPAFDEPSSHPREPSRALDAGPRTVDLGPRTLEQSSSARAVCENCGNDWPAEYGTKCHECNHSPAVEKPDQPETKACTCGEDYRNSYRRRCLDCEGVPSQEQLDARR